MRPREFSVIYDLRISGRTRNTFPSCLINSKRSSKVRIPRVFIVSWYDLISLFKIWSCFSMSAFHETYFASMRPPVALTGNLRRCSSRRLWNATPISVRNTSRFFPPRFCRAASRTFASMSQQAIQGSVLTRANERSSFRGYLSCLGMI